MTHFSNLFASSLPPIEDELLDLFSPSILDEENIELCTIPYEQEIVQALLSLGSTKTPSIRNIGLLSRTMCYNVS